jgi:exoribonuclease-2
LTAVLLWFLIKANRIHSGHLRYWAFKHLSLRRGTALRALVLDELKTKYPVVLTDFLLIADLKRKNWIIIRQEKGFSVSIINAEPWNDILALNIKSNE